MESVLIIQEELKKQQRLIESLEGKVNVAKYNPTPAEITAGIKSIPSVDLSGSTATEEDVRQGKTFYSGNAFLKTGTAILSENITNHLFMSPFETQTSEEDIYYSVPDGIKTIRKYCFYENHNKVTIYLDDDLGVIDEYAFYETINFSFPNFNDLPKLSSLAIHCFDNSSAEGIDMGRLPDTITNVGSYCFYYSVKPNLDFKLPDKLSTMGQYAFMSKSRILQNSLDLTNFKLKTLPAYTFYNQAFNCDFSAPSTVTSVAMYFNYNGCFKNIYMPTGASFSNYCFSANATQPVENFYLRTVTFETETPPSIGKDIFAPQNITNGFRIYVPDNALEEYKAVENLASYVNNIYPYSEIV